MTANDRDTGDGGRVRYSCGSGCDKFIVATAGGEVVLSSVLDADHGNTELTVIVVATDSGIVPRSATATVIVTGEMFL